MKYYKPEHFSGKYSVSDGTPFETLVEQVLTEYYPEISEITTRGMAEEIAELRVMAYQEGAGWLFSDPLNEHRH